MAASTSSSQIVVNAILDDKLVELWPEYPCLYDVRSTEFKNREKRDLAFSDIAAKLDQTNEWVKARLKSLRNSYTKAKKAPSSGSARKLFTKKTKWLLEKLQFLAPHVASRTSSISNLDSESSTQSGLSELDSESIHLDDGEESFHQEESEPSTPLSDIEPESAVRRSTNEPLKSKPMAPRKRQAEEEYYLIKGLAESFSQRAREKKSVKQNAIATFGNYVAQTLSELEPQVRLVAQNQISNILFQAQMGMLGHYSQRSCQPYSQTSRSSLQHPFGYASQQQNEWSVPIHQPADFAFNCPQQNE